MPSWSRRRALQAVAATATTALAGCNASTERSGSVSRGRDGDPVTDYEAETVRDSDGRALFWRDEDGETERETEREREEMVLLTEPLSESEIAVASDVPAAEALRSFAADTDFESRSVLLYATRVSGCRRIRVEGVSREPEQVDVSLCRVLRSADVACETDADHTAGVGVRLPFPAEDVTGTGMRISSTCRRTPEPVTLGGDGS